MTAVETPRASDPVPAGSRSSVARGFPLLDGYRALAATAVVVTHVGFNTGAALNGRAAGLLARLDSGVALSFLISGFLLFRPWALSQLLGSPRPAAGPTCGGARCGCCRRCGWRCSASRCWCPRTDR